MLLKTEYCKENQNISINLPHKKHILQEQYKRLLPIVVLRVVYLKLSTQNQALTAV